MNESSQLIPMTVGERFKFRRLELGHSLADVAAAVRLDERLLEAIEEDRELAVAPVYRKGYLKKYAAFLGIPEQDIAEVLGAPLPEPGLRSVFSEPARRSVADTWLRAASYVLGSLLIGTLAWQLTHEAMRLSRDDLPESSVAATESAADRVRDGGSNTVAASVAPLGALHEGQAAAGDTAERAWAALTRLPLAEGESRLKIGVSADSWVELVDATGKELEMDLLRGGSVKEYAGRPPFRILIGRSAAVRLAIDGEDVDLAAYTRDEVAHFTWPAVQPEKDQ